MCVCVSVSLCLSLCVCMYIDIPTPVAYQGVFSPPSLRYQVFSSSGLWTDTEANMVQLSQIPGGHCLGHHIDRRDKWDEGIASLAWSATEGQNDPRCILSFTPFTLHSHLYSQTGYIQRAQEYTRRRN